ncbi:MAG TPA: hypothetical protein VLA56_19460 [Pseudomonadales bacterium]|nr:hypothetical protein [Pseudomonadales bacterium]
MTRRQTLIAALMLCLGAEAGAYPLDGQEDTGIRRLEGYRLAQEAKSGPKLTSGQLLSTADIRLRLLDYSGPDFDELPQDPDLAAFLAATLAPRDPSYTMVIVDLTDPARIRWAGLRPDLQQNAGSVGKLVTMAGFFMALRDAFPDTAERARILRETSVRAGDWIGVEQHKVPKWQADTGLNASSVIVPADEFRLSEWLDHAISASANGAGAIVWREAMLLRHFGSAYPVTEEARTRFFAQTPKAELGALALATMTDPLREAGIDTANLQQGSLWTANAKAKIPGSRSFATARELTRVAFRIEQGRLVDEWSSLEMKKYLYMTKRRYRYAYAPELARSAVYFKSGSLYSCKAEEGFRCGKYMGNDRNLMNSVAIVEGDGASDREPQLHYIATLMSNVLRFNSAWDHARIAAAVHETLRTRQIQTLQEAASARTIEESGKSE